MTRVNYMGGGGGASGSGCFCLINSPWLFDCLAITKWFTQRWVHFYHHWSITDVPSSAACPPPPPPPPVLSGTLTSDPCGVQNCQDCLSLRLSRIGITKSMFARDVSALLSRPPPLKSYVIRKEFHFPEKFSAIPFSMCSL